MGLDELHTANLDNAQEDVSQLRFENRILRRLVNSAIQPNAHAPYSRPWNAHRTRDTDRTNADAMLARINGEPAQLKDFHSQSNADKRAFRLLTKEKLVVRVKRGFWKKATL